MHTLDSWFGKTVVTGALLVGILVGSLAAATVAAGADQAPEDLSGHPLVGVWLSMVPGAPDAPAVANPTMFTADGKVLLVEPVTQSGPQGVRWASGGMGAWERTDDRSAAFRIVVLLSDADGAYLGTSTIEGTLTVSEDGTTATDTSPASRVTIHDPAGKIVQIIEGHRDLQPVTATRISLISPSFQSGPDCGTCGPLES
jgi:hypothetical protein